MTNYETWFGSPELAAATLKDLFVSIEKDARIGERDTAPAGYILQETCGFTYADEDIPATHELIVWLQEECDE